MKVDIRSEQEREISRVETALRDAMRREFPRRWLCRNCAARETEKGSALQIEVKILGARPGGELAADSPLMAALMDADKCVGNTSAIERSSTDANIPLSMGIPAISMGGGGRAGGAHTLGEWFDPSGREMGLKRVLLTVLGVAGVEK